MYDFTYYCELRWSFVYSISKKFGQLTTKLHAKTPCYYVKKFTVYSW